MNIQILYLSIFGIISYLVVGAIIGLALYYLVLYLLELPIS